MTLKIVLIVTIEIFVVGCEDMFFSFYIFTYICPLTQVTHTRLMLLHDSRSDDGIKSFFQEVHELYIKILLNPLYLVPTRLPGSRVTSPHFDTKVRAFARRYL